MFLTRNKTSSDHYYYFKPVSVPTESREFSGMLVQTNVKKRQKTLGTRLSHKLKLKFSCEILFDHGLNFIFLE